jgi:hypothetical protein
MQKLKKFFLSLFFFVIFCVLGLIVGVGGGYGVLILGGQGAFSSWELLKGDHQFEKIITADNQTVWVQASDGKVYSWNTNCYRENCNQWVEVKEIPKNDSEYSSGTTIDIGSSCGTDDRVQNAPGKVVECAKVIESMADFGMTVYYALLDDDQIWMWKHSGSNIEFELIPLCGGFLGIVAGIIGFIVFLIRRATKGKETPTSPV